MDNYEQETKVESTIDNDEGTENVVNNTQTDEEVEANKILDSYQAGMKIVESLAKITSTNNEEQKVKLALEIEKVRLEKLRVENEIKRNKINDENALRQHSIEKEKCEIEKQKCEIEKQKVENEKERYSLENLHAQNQIASQRRKDTFGLIGSIITGVTAVATTVLSIVAFKKTFNISMAAEYVDNVIPRRSALDAQKALSNFIKPRL